MTITRDAGVAEIPVASAARTVSGSIVAGTNYGSADSLRAQVDVTAASGTAPTLDVVIEDTLDGTNWNVIGTFAQKVTVGREVINITIPFTDQVRVRWTIGGVAPSFTFSVRTYVQ